MAPGILNSPAASQVAAAPLAYPPPADSPSTSEHVPLSTRHHSPSSKHVLLSTLHHSPYRFLQPPQALHASALQFAKHLLDPLASSVSQRQELRLQDARRKRKRGEDEVDGARNILRLKQVHFDGFEIEQIWEQARRVLDASRHEIERSLSALPLEKAQIPSRSTDGGSLDQVKVVRFDEDGFEVGSGSEALGGSGEAAEDASDKDNGLEDDAMDETFDNENEVEEDEPNREEEGDIEDGGTDLGMDEDLDEAETEVFKPDKHGLNDGFFSIDAFNRNSEFLEQQDARGDLDDGRASDEEEIDWDVDPITQSLAPFNKAGTQENDDASDDDGPTFGSADLEAPFSSDSEEEDDVQLEDTTLSNTNDIKYDDFFAPPPLRSGSRPRNRPLPKTQPPASKPAEDDIQRTISAVRRDLFEDDLSPSAATSDNEDLNPSGNPENPSTARLSTHEKRQLRLAAQIRKLEAENVAKRNWTLAGEARAAERPLNSLLEEDLEFERTGKPVPVITAAVSEDIEALIKRRILAREFDEVIKRRPESLNAPEGVKRGRAELDDTKSKVGLGELYAEDHLRAVDPAGFLATRDAGLKKQHGEVERLWAEVSAKLDALSSWHYRPKPPEVQVRVVSDVPAVSMEEARPSGIGGIGATEGESRLAPQEVFAVGEGVAKGEREVVGGAGMVAREEMSREEKLRRRRREKERLRKKEGEGGKGKGKEAVKEGTKASEKQSVVADLKKGGVRVIGKKGEVRDVEGKVASGSGGARGGGNFKL